MTSASVGCVVALGGNALVQEGEAGTVAETRANLHTTLAALRPLVDSGARMCITHGNGPQVGNALLRAEAGEREGVPPQPLGVAVATTQGEIGSMIMSALASQLAAWELQRSSAALVTHVLVDADDPALREPTKPVGPWYTEAEARELERDRGWRLVEQHGRGWRRVVGSPHPRAIVELQSVRRLFEDGTIVIAGGGGGVPVPVRDMPGTGQQQLSLDPIDAVIDKDHTAALLAEQLEAGRLIILTSVDAVYRDYGSPAQQAVRHLHSDEARELVASGELPPGSMGPKVQAAASFAARTGCPAIVTNARSLAAALDGRAGTTIG